jgi:peptide/nickel transport system substrate-binding protein
MPFTARYTGQEGGLVQWVEPDLLVDPANPVAGSNWVYDAVWQNPTQSYAVVDHPHTGLYLPFRLERAEVTVESGLPVSKTYDWLTLEFADEIAVPGDAWVDWDAENQVFITADEKFPDGLTSVTKTVYYYPADMFDIVQWHDGSSLTIGDFIMNWIMTFDIAKEASELYDESSVPGFDAFLGSFKGYKLISTDPFVFEYYTDLWYGDAEWIASTAEWPQYGFGEAQWAMIAVGNKAEAKLQATYSADKGDANEVEWQNWIAGPTLAILEENLAEATTEAYIPFEPTMGQYVTAEEAAARYANIQAFYEEYGHFWIGTGPYILDDVFSVEKTLTLIHNPNFPDLADRWDGFATPKSGEVAVDGPGRVTTGAEATFDIFVEFQGEPYPADEVAEVKYILFNANNEVVETGLAELVADGQYVVTLSAETTALLGSGANKMDVVGVFLPVALPSVVTFEFVSE